MDQGVLETIKRRYKCDLLLRMLNEETTIDVFSKKLNILDAVMMAARSWMEVKESTLAQSWNKLLGHKEPDQEPTHDQPAGVTTEINAILDRLDVPVDERIDWLKKDDNDTGYHDYTDEEIITLVHNEIESGDNNVDSEDDEDYLNASSISHAQACEALETVHKYLDQQPDVAVSTRMTVHNLLMQAAKRRLESKRQSKLNEYFSEKMNNNIIISLD